MASHRVSSVYSYFREADNKFICKIEKEGKPCESSYAPMKAGSGSAAGNLKRHLKRAHPTEFLLVEEKDHAAKRQVPDKDQPRLPFLPQPKITVNVPMHKDKFISGILKMIAYDATPLTFFARDGFKTINGLAAQQLGVPLGRNAIRRLVLDRAEEEKKKLSKHLEGKLFYLKFDGVTRLRSHFLGITIQYWTEEGPTIKTLALVDTEAHHDSVHLKEFVLKVMQKFGLQLSHVLACVVDNASNMTKTIELLNKERDEVEEGDGEGEEEEEQEEENEEEDMDDSEDEEDEEEDEEEEEVEVRDGDEIDLNEFPNLDETIFHGRCASHTLNLGIEDQFKKGTNNF